jgi:hypothetical protein
MPNISLTMHFSCMQVQCAFMSKGEPVSDCFHCFTFALVAPTQYVNKPGLYKSEYELLYDVYMHAMGCTRYYYNMWCACCPFIVPLRPPSVSLPSAIHEPSHACRYEKLIRAGHRLPPPHWDGPPVPSHNETHDALVSRERQHHCLARAPVGGGGGGGGARRGPPPPPPPFRSV